MENLTVEKPTKRSILQMLSGLMLPAIVRSEPIPPIIPGLVPNGSGGWDLPADGDGEEDDTEVIGAGDGGRRDN